MFFFNITFAQFAALLGSVSALVVALYLLDRSRRKQVVATLRFWVAAEQPTAVARRKRIQQPWSLLLQLASICLLLLAIAQLRIGSQASIPFDHVVILETSAWMGARSTNRTPANKPMTLMDEARARAKAYIHALPDDDRVMLVRAGALATPATPFETNRHKLEDAIAESEPGATALNLEQAMEFARQIRQLSARRPGEIVFIGSGRIPESEAASIPSVPNLRVLPVNDAPEDCGLRRIGLRRSSTDPAVWEIFVSARNYGTKPRNVNLALQFGGAPAGSRALTLAPGAEQEALFEYRTRAAGQLEARLTPHDAFPADDRAVIELPGEKTLSVVVYSNEPELLRPMLEASPQVHASYRKTAEYSPDPRGAKKEATLVILDRFHPPSPPVVDSIWIEPPAIGSPIPVRKTVKDVKLTTWHTEHPLGEGLRSKDLHLDSAVVLEAAPTDIRIADVDEGPVIVARPGTPKIVVIGFHPARSAMRYALTTPLLFANSLRWIAPDIFRRRDVIGGSVGAVNVAIDPDTDPVKIRVTQEDGTSLPFTMRNRSLQFFAGAPGIVRVTAADREFDYSLVLPEVSEAKWEPPIDAKHGIPAHRGSSSSALDVWQALACLGMAGLIADWVLYGRLGRTAMRSGAASPAPRITQSPLRRKIGFAGRRRS